MESIEYKPSPPVTNRALNALFAEAWPGPWPDRDFGPVPRRSLGYVCACQEDELVVSWPNNPSVRRSASWIQVHPARYTLCRAECHRSDVW